VPSSRLDTDLTVVQCAADLANQSTTHRVLQFTVTSEFESRFTVATTASCHATYRLADLNQIFDLALLGTRTAQTRLQTSAGSRGGLLGIAEEVRSAGAARAVAATTLHGEGGVGAVDLVLLP
jgi:hypothetical protein